MATAGVLALRTPWLEQQLGGLDRTYRLHKYLGITAGVMLASPWIARMMGSDQVVVPLLWVAPVFVLGALQGVPQSVLERRLAFGQLTTAEVSAALASSVVAVIMVLLGFKLGALIAQMMAGPIVNLLDPGSRAITGEVTLIDAGAHLDIGLSRRPGRDL